MVDTAKYNAPQNLLPERMKNTRALVCVLMIMAYLAGLSLLFARASVNLSADWQAQLTNTATVQILTSSAQNRQEQVTLAQDTLRSILPRAEITAMSSAEARALLRPWLGSANLPEDLPIPSLVTVKAKTSLPVSQIKTALAAQGLTVNIDDHTRYSGGLKRTSRALIFGSSLILSLLLIASLAVNIFATRASMLAQKDIIQVLAQVGATDKFVAHLFIRQAAKRALLAVAIGMGLAVFTWVVLALFDLGALKQSGLISRRLGLGIFDVLFMIGLGLFFVLICAMAAGITTLRELSRQRSKI